jgi:hypothetical protein
MQYDIVQVLQIVPVIQLSSTPGDPEFRVGTVHVPEVRVRNPLEIPRCPLRYTATYSPSVGKGYRYLVVTTGRFMFYDIQCTRQQFTPKTLK